MSHDPPPIPVHLGVKKSGSNISIMACACIIVAAFFSPYFCTLVSTNALDPRDIMLRTGKSVTTFQPYFTLLMGWKFWWGIVSACLGFIALSMSIADMSTQRILVMRRICKWIIFYTFVAVLVFNLAGILMSLFGIGMEANLDWKSDGISHDIWMSFAEIQQRDNGKPSLLAIPLASAAAAIFGLIGFIVALRLRTGKSK